MQFYELFWLDYWLWGNTAYDVREESSAYVEFKQPCTINLGDYCSILAYGKGTYQMLADLDGNTQHIALHDVFYLPDLEKNFLSVHAMFKIGSFC